MTRVSDFKDEMKMNKVATKKSAKDALEVEGVKERAAELEQAMEQLQVEHLPDA